MISKGSVLIVEDEVGCRESLRMILKPIYEVHTAENGQEAVNFITQKKVDLVTLALNLRGLSGIDVLKEIRKLQPDTAVMIVSGYGTLSNAQEVFKYGAETFISKPFKVADIIIGVSKALERRNQNMEIKALIQRFQGLRSSPPWA